MKLGSPKMELPRRLMVYSVSDHKWPDYKPYKPDLALTQDRKPEQTKST